MRGESISTGISHAGFRHQGRKSRYFGGTTGGSEPETRFVMTLVDSLRVGMIITLHAPLTCVNHDGPAEAHARRLAGLMKLPHRSDIGYATPGSLGTWAGRERGIPILTVELPARVTPRSLRTHASALVTFLRELR
jgi:murein peptide amidase A